MSVSVLCVLGVSETCASSESLLKEEAPVSKHLPKIDNSDLDHLYDVGLNVFLQEESDKESQHEHFMAEHKMSTYAPLRGENYMFREYYMLGDGSCAKYAMGTTPLEAQALLLNRGIAVQEPLPTDENGDPVDLSAQEEQQRAAAFALGQQQATQIREIAHLEIFDLFHDNPDALPYAIRNSDRFTELNVALLNVDDFLEAQTISHEMAAQQKDDLVAAWAKEEGTFRDYVTYAFGPGVFTRFEQHFEGEFVRTYLINALAYAMQKNLNIWHQIVDERNVHARPSQEMPQGEFVRIHNYTVNAVWPTAHLVHRGGQFHQGQNSFDDADHFNRLVPVGNAQENEQALQDETRHLINLQRSGWKYQLYERYSKIKYAVMHDFTTSNQPIHQALKIQAGQYCQSVEKDAEIIEAFKQSPLAQREILLSRTILARAYALAINQLEAKDALNEGEQAKLLAYRHKCDAFRLLGFDFDAFSEEEIALELPRLYQGVSYENDYYKARKVSPEENVQCATAYELYEVMRALYLHEEKLMRKTAQESLLYNCQKSAHDAKIALETHGNLYIRPAANARLRDLKVSQQYQAATNILRDFCEAQRRAGRAYINPDLFVADPFVHIWSYDIENNDKYAQAPTEKEFITFATQLYREIFAALQKNGISADLTQVLAGVARHFDGQKWIEEEPGSLGRLVDVFKKATKAASGHDAEKVAFQENMRRRIMRLYDLFEENAAREKTPRAEWIADFCNKICMNPRGCLDGVETTVNHLETSIFGGLNARSLEAAVSKILIQDRLSFINSHSRIAGGAEARNAIPRVLEKALALPWSLGKIPTAMYAAGCGIQADCTVERVTSRYLRGETIGGQVFEARTPQKWETLLYEAYQRDVRMSKILRKSEIKRSIQEKAYLEENRNNLRLDAQQLTAFMQSDERMMTEYDRVFMDMEDSEFLAMDENNMFKPAFFGYFLKRTGYVLDPQHPEITLWKAEGAERDDVLAKRKKEQSDFFKALLRKQHNLENKGVPQDFDAADYLSLHNDLSDYAQSQGLQGQDVLEFGRSHYEQYGCNEGRVYQIVPKEFKSHEYLALHEDLVEHLARSNSSLKDALDFGRTHYKTWGCLKEKRPYQLAVMQRRAEGCGLPADFSAMTYLAIHFDILTYYLDQNYSLVEALNTATMHYINNGIKEGRAYK